MLSATFKEPDCSGLSGVGIGLRRPHYDDFLRGRPEVDWLEVHTENYLGPGGYDLRVLEAVRRDYAVSLHGVGLGLGSTEAVDRRHLKRIVDLVDRIEPSLVSEHLCWGRVSGRHLNDLLPLPLTEEAIQTVCDNVDVGQNAIRRPILIENVSTHLRYIGDTVSEMDFLTQVARKTGCRVLLDINNLYVNQCNHSENALQALYALRIDDVAEMHLAGHLVTKDSVVDHHGARVAQVVWDLYREAVKRFGKISTLIEWDADIPSLVVLLDEVRLARDLQDAIWDVSVDAWERS